MRSVLLASNNPGKIRELRALLAPAQARLLTPADLLLDLQLVEDGQDYAANASLKALGFARAANMLAVGDDSGLEVEALDGAPGLYSARAAGPAATDADRRRMLLERLAPLPPPWPARFVCAMALASPEGTIAIAHGVCRGQIGRQERGDSGFGYDPIFIVEDSGMTMAELPEERKNQISHRARAAQALLPRLLAALQAQSAQR